MQAVNLPFTSLNFILCINKMDMLGNPPNFRWIDKEVKGKGCKASYYASASITNQVDFDYAYDNDDVEAIPEP